MPKATKEPVKMKVFQKGQIVIPVSLRQRYHIDIGDRLDVVPTNDGILLKSPSTKERKSSLTDELFGIFKKYQPKGSGLEKENIIKATEKGFTEGWGI